MCNYTNSWTIAQIHGRIALSKIAVSRISSDPGYAILTR